VELKTRSGIVLCPFVMLAEAVTPPAAGFKSDDPRTSVPSSLLETRCGSAARSQTRPPLVSTHTTHAPPHHTPHITHRISEQPPVVHPPQRPPPHTQETAMAGPPVRERARPRAQDISAPHTAPTPPPASYQLTQNAEPEGKASQAGSRERVSLAMRSTALSVMTSLWQSHCHMAMRPCDH